MMPIMLLGYLAPIGSLATGQDTPLMRTLTFVPWTAPFSLSMRAGLGTLRGWELAVAGAEILLAIALSAVVAGRIYRNSILRTGKRVRIIAA